MTKSRDAFRTISEVADWLDTPAHVLRFWESKFSQVKPVKRAGGRRYYRPQDMELLSGIKTLLHEDGMTIKGVQKLLREKGVKHVAAMGKPLEDGLGSALVDAIEHVVHPDEAPARTAEKAPTSPRVVPLHGRDGPGNEAPAPDAAHEAAPSQESDAEDRQRADDAPTPEPVAPEPASTPAPEPALRAHVGAKGPWPADPADSSSRARARFFRLYRRVPDPDAQLARHAKALAPLVSRLATLRGRIRVE